ncbi:peptidoglycan-binding protein LysM [Rhodoferax sp.]|uniref:peptidoglycan-binding protein LysM n=1 Tax=Rhodoferax sp. TaxID=50421 RepID=UPI0025E1188B|nr:peptidoglycan-binding protein LysM [Rhodoferax sp.]
MGMISFIKEAGEKLFGSKPEIAAAVAEPTNEEKAVAANAVASEAIGKYIVAQGLSTDGLTISFSGADQIVTVAGAVADQEAREKIIVCCGNVHGVAGVADEMTCPEVPECTYHTVVSGDTLSAVAKKAYGNANLYPQIFEANKPMLSSPDKIYPGQVLRIPPQ